MKFMDDSWRSRKLIFAFLIIVLAWSINSLIDVEKLRILTGFTEVVFGIYAGANVGNYFVNSRAQLKKPADKPGEPCQPKEGED